MLRAGVVMVQVVIALGLALSRRRRSGKHRRMSRRVLPEGALQAFLARVRVCTDGACRRSEHRSTRRIVQRLGKLTPTVCETAGGLSLHAFVRFSVNGVICEAALKWWGRPLALTHR